MVTQASIWVCAVRGSDRIISLLFASITQTPVWLCAVKEVQTLWSLTTFSLCYTGTGLIACRVEYEVQDFTTKLLFLPVYTGSSLDLCRRIETDFKHLMPIVLSGRVGGWAWAHHRGGGWDRGGPCAGHGQHVFWQGQAWATPGAHRHHRSGVCSGCREKRWGAWRARGTELQVIV